MTVVDASVVVELLLRGEESGPAWPRLLGEQGPWHAPSLLDVEVLQTLRRYQTRNEILTTQAEEAVATLRSLPLLRYPHEPMIPRIWALRHALSAYDAAYVVLAEALRAPLVTLDARLAASHGHTAAIELLQRA